MTLQGPNSIVVVILIALGGRLSFDLLRSVVAPSAVYLAGYPIDTYIGVSSSCSLTI